MVGGGRILAIPHIINSAILILWLPSYVIFAGCDFTNGFQCLEHVRLPITATESNDASRYVSVVLQDWKFFFSHT